MKKLIALIICIFMLFSLCSCSGEDDDLNANIPPAFSVLQKQLKLTKQGTSGDAASFSKTEFLDFFGEDFSCITVTSLPENGNLICNGKSVLKGQTITADEIEYLKYIPMEQSIYGEFSFTGDCEGYNGQEMKCEIVFKNGENAPPVANDVAFETVEGMVCQGELNITEPNGDIYTINVETYPEKGLITVNEKGKIIYTPHSGFSGKDRMVYSVTDCFGKKSQSAVVDFQVLKNESGIYFADMKDDENHIFAHRMCEKDIMIYHYENGEYYFQPDANVSKMDFLVMLMCVSGLNKDIVAVADSVVDDDTGLSSGFKGYLSSAYEKNLILLENGRFSPKDNITLEDAVYMASAALDLPEGSKLFDFSVDREKLAGVVVSEEDGNNIMLTKSQVAQFLCMVEDYMLENNVQNND